MCYAIDLICRRFVFTDYEISLCTEYRKKLSHGGDSAMIERIKAQETALAAYCHKTRGPIVEPESPLEMYQAPEAFMVKALNGAGTRKEVVFFSTINSSIIYIIQMKLRRSNNSRFPELIGL